MYRLQGARSLSMKSSFSQQLDKPSLTYQAQPDGFWFRMDARLDKVKSKAEKIWNSKPLTPVKTTFRVVKEGWQSKWAAPIRLPVTYTLRGLNKITNHPAMKIGSTGYFIATGVKGAIAGAATGGIGLGIVLGIGVGLGVTAKIVKTVKKAHQKNKIRSLEKQASLLLKLQKIREKENNAVRKIKKKKNGRAALEELQNYTSRRAHDLGKVFQRTLTAKSKELAKNLAITVLDASSIGIDAYSVAHTAIIDKTAETKNIAAHHAVHHAGRVLSHANLGANIKTGVKVAGKDVPLVQNIPKRFKSEREYENALKQQINELARELDVPKMKNTAELADYVRNSASDARALTKLARSTEPFDLERPLVRSYYGQPVRIGGEPIREMTSGVAKDFLREKDKAQRDHSLDLPEQSRASFSKRMVIRSAEVFFGTSEEWVKPIKSIKDKAKVIASTMGNLLFKNIEKKKHSVSSNVATRKFNKTEGKGRF